MKTILIITLVSFCLVLAYKIGRLQQKKEIIDRALEIQKESFTNEDIEYIIFNESQL